MAAKKRAQRIYVVTDGPGLLELQFSDYNPQGHIVEFTVEEVTSTGAPADDSTGSGGSRTLRILYCQVTGSDRIEHVMKDVLRCPVAGSARLVRLREGIIPYEGWYDAHTREGVISEMPLSKKR